MAEAENQVVKTPEQLAAEKEAAEQQTAALVAAIKQKFNNKVDVVDASFAFRKVESKVEVDSVDPETGEPIKKVQTVSTKRPTVELKVPRPSFEGVLSILELGSKDNATIAEKKQYDLLFEAITDVILTRAREIVDEQKDANQDNFPMEELSWEKIANLPKAERRGGGIAQETWKDFVTDYLDVMVAVSGRTKERVEMATKLFVNKFATCKTDKPVLKFLKDQLTLYIANTQKGEEFAECVAFLTDKIDTLVSADSTKLLDNL